MDLARNRLDDDAHILLDCQRKSKSEKGSSSNGSSTDSQRLLYSKLVEWRDDIILYCHYITDLLNMIWRLDGDYQLGQ